MVGPTSIFFQPPSEGWACSTQNHKCTAIIILEFPFPFPFPAIKLSNQKITPTESSLPLLVLLHLAQRNTYDILSPYPAMQAQDVVFFMPFIEQTTQCIFASPQLPSLPTYYLATSALCQPCLLYTHQEKQASGKNTYSLHCQNVLLLQYNH